MFKTLQIIGAALITVMISWLFFVVVLLEV